MASAIQSQSFPTSTSARAVIKSKEAKKRLKQLVNAIVVLMIAIAAIILAVGITFMCLQSVTSGIPLVAVAGGIILIGLVTLVIQQIKDAHNGTQVDKRRDKIAGIRKTPGFVKENLIKKEDQLAAANIELYRIRDERIKLEQAQTLYNEEVVSMQKVITEKEADLITMDRKMIDLVQADRKASVKNGPEYQKMITAQKDMKILKKDIKELKKIRDKAPKTNHPEHVKISQMEEKEAKIYKQVSLLDREVTELKLALTQLPSDPLKIMNSRIVSFKQQ